MGVDQRRTARELVEFRQECARPFLDDQLRKAQRVLAAHRHVALQDDEHPQTDFTGPKELVNSRWSGTLQQVIVEFEMVRPTSVVAPNLISADKTSGKPAESAVRSVLRCHELREIGRAGA